MPSPRTTVVDTIGAGDAFGGGVFKEAETGSGFVRFFNSKNNPNVLLTIEGLKKGAIVEISGMVDFFPGKEKLFGFF